METRDFIITDIDTLATACQGTILKKGTLPFSGKISTDSRNLSKDSFFIALKGENFDGHDFIQDALQKKISGIITEKNYEHLLKDFNSSTFIKVNNCVEALGKIANYKRKKAGIKIFGVTGSVGKTSTREILKSILSTKFKVHGPLKNFNNHIGVPITILEIEKQHDSAVIEMGMSRKGEIEYLSKIAVPDFAIITKLAPAHIEFFENIEEIAQEKASIAKGMKKDSFIIINEEDHILEKYIQGMNILKFGFSKDSDLFITNMKLDNSYTTAEFNINTPFLKEKFKVRINIPGATMIKNAAGAALCSAVYGINPAEIARGISDYNGTGGRFFTIHDQEKNIFIIDDTYNANPESLKASAKDFALIKKDSRGFAVIGDMLELGKNACHYHVKSGELLGDLGLEGIFACGDFADKIIEGAKNTAGEKTILYKGGHKQISDELLKILQPGDYVLVKGSRGSKMETIIENLTQKTE